jgi:hypothetical protein
MFVGTICFLASMFICLPDRLFMVSKAIKGMVLIYRTANLLNRAVIKGSLINLDFVDLLLLCLESF